MKKIIFFVHQWNLRKKFIVLISLCICFVSLTASFTTMHVLNRYDQTLYTLNADLSRNIQNDIDDELEQISAYTGQFLADAQVQSSLSTIMDTADQIQINSAGNALYNSLNYYLFTNPYISTISLDYHKGVLHLGSPDRPSADYLQSTGKEISEKNGRYFWKTSSENDGKIYCIREIREKSRISLRPLAVLYIGIDFDKFLEDTAGSHMQNYHFLVASDTQVIAPSISEDLSMYLKFIHLDSPYTIQSISGTKYFITHGNFESIPWNWVSLMDYHTIFKDIQSLKLFYIITMLVTLLCVFPIADYLIRQILGKVQTLVNKMELFQEGKLTTLLEAPSDQRTEDELGLLNNSFDNMVIEFNQLINDNYVKQILIKDARMKLLQQQINPHFLYNTLDSINWMAQKYQADDISVMAQALGTLFRGSISDDSDRIPLKAELEFADSYIQIQKIRFRERLQYEMTIPDKYGAILFPRMTLQPVIENAIKHGLEENFDPCTIVIALDEDSNHYYIHISNTGSSFEKDFLEKLRNNEIISQGTGIGLLNIDKRLQLLYNDNYDFTFHNINHMAVVTITLPKETEETLC